MLSPVDTKEKIVTVYKLCNYLIYLSLFSVISVFFFTVVILDELNATLAILNLMQERQNCNKGRTIIKV